MKMIFNKAFWPVAALLCSACSYAPENTSLPDEKTLSFNAEHPPAIQGIHFPSHGDRLNGMIYLADGPGPHPAVILLHGYPGNEKNLDLAQSLRAAGFNVMFFHYRGAWGSEGDFSFAHVIEDVTSATDYLRDNAKAYRTNPDAITLIGHSMGGFAALQGAAKDRNVHCVGSLAGADFGMIANYFAQNQEAAEGFSAGTDNMQMLAGWSGQKALADLAENGRAYSLSALVSSLSGKSVLLVAADKDKIVMPAIHHRPMVEAYEPQEGITLTHAIIPGDHAFSWSRDALINTVTQWVEGCR